ncbi:MAG TPA: hypothetical protein VMA09_19835 [Candidatus Binataceae bacterium]|nr:hypothetical protein [Candidatus Binataceae bacterium]
MQQLEQELAAIANLPTAERAKERTRLEAQFDLRLRELYSQVAEEYPGERKKKARPIEDPH